MTKNSSQFHIAQINIARMKAPLDDPQMQAFVEGLEPINALADDAPGFVWRLQDAAGDATSYRPFPDDWLIVNMSVWQSVESLRQFTYKTVHINYVKQRKAWFEKTDYRILLNGNVIVCETAVSTTPVKS